MIDAITKTYRALRRFHRNEDATALLEFVMTAPIFITVFAGVISLGQIGMVAVASEIHAHNHAFNQVRGVQDSGILGGVFSGTPEHAVHLSPVSGGQNAYAQIKNFPSRSKNEVAGGLVDGYEMATYFAGMTFAGHFGESFARLKPFELTGAVEMLGVERHKTLNPGPEHLLGDSLLAYDQIYDGPDYRAAFRLIDAFSAAKNDSADLAMIITTVLNAVINTTGARSALGAGVRFGTVTGRETMTADVAGGLSYTFKPHYTVTVPPFVSGSPAEDQLRALTLSRLTMINLDFRIYNETLAFSKYDTAQKYVPEGDPEYDPDQARPGQTFDPDTPMDFRVPKAADRFKAPFTY